MDRTIIAMLLAVATLAVLSLASGADYLGAALPGGLPLGNALAALGLCATAGAAVRLSATGSALRVATWASLVSALIWLPASITLAGNLTLTFSGWRGAAWLTFSLVVVAAVLCALGSAFVSSLIAIDRSRGS